MVPARPGRAPAKAFGAALLFGWRLCAAALLLGAAPASFGADYTPRWSVTGFRQPYMENNVLKALYGGGASHPVLGGVDKIVIENGFFIETFRDGDTNRVESFTRGSSCVFDKKARSFSSDGRITIFSLATNGLGVLATNLVISGLGFSSEQSNNVFEIWSDVRTALSTRTNAASATTSPLYGPPAPEEAVVIHSEFLQFSQFNWIASYRGRVRADQFPYTLECPVMDVHLSTNRAPANIFAEDGVLITDERDQGHATGERARFEAGSGLFHLTGAPHWIDSLGRQVWAREFVFDRGAGVIRALGEARALLPGKTAETGGMGLPGDPSRTNTAGDSVYDIRADSMEFEAGGGDLPSAGRSGSRSRRFSAHQHVVMTNEVEQSWAAGDDVVFSEATGILHLTGRAKWIRGPDQIEGDVIEADRKEKTVRSRGRSVVRVPSRSMSAKGAPTAGDSGPGPVEVARTEPPRPAAGMFEVHSEDFLWRTNVATFTAGAGKVRAFEFEGGERAGRMDCRLLTLTFDNTNRIRQLRASGGVIAEEFPTTARNSSLHATCEVLNVWWHPGGQFLKRVEAERLTGLDQTIEDPRKRSETARSARADNAWANFSAMTNQVESALAEGKVWLLQTEELRNAQGAVLQRDQRGALGKRAEYAAEPAGQGLILTGEPLGWMERTNMTMRRFVADLVTNATALAWSPASGKIRGEGRYQIQPLRPGQEPRSP